MTSLSSDRPRLKRNLSLFGHVRWEHCAAGVGGGVVSTLVLHPLDLIKIRFQVNEGMTIANRPKYSGIFNALVTIRKQEGVRGLYQGVTPNVWGAGASWGLYFLFYQTLKTNMQHKKELRVLSSGQHMIVAAQAGVLTLVITNPIWVAKTRLCLQYDSSPSTQKTLPSGKAIMHYRGMADCLYKIYKYEGIRGLYKGFTPGMFGVSHGALQFMAYEELKKMYNAYKNLPLDSKFSSSEYLVFAALSKIFAAGTTYPYQVVRSRLQDQHRSYTGVIDVLRQTWRLEGFVGYYKGLSPYLLHVTPNICIVFLIYEKVTNYVNARNEAQLEAAGAEPAKMPPLPIYAPESMVSTKFYGREQNQKDDYCMWDTETSQDYSDYVESDMHPDFEARSER